MRCSSDAAVFSVDRAKVFSVDRAKVFSAEAVVPQNFTENKNTLGKTSEIISLPRWTSMLYENDIKLKTE